MNLSLQHKFSLMIPLLALCLFPLALACGPRKSTDVHYAIICSQLLRPGVDFRIGVVHVPKFSGHSMQSVKARLNTTSSRKTFLRIEREAVWQRQPNEEKNWAEISMKISGGPADFDPEGKYRLEVLIEDSIGNCYKNSTDVTLSYSPVTTLIQTDKAVYKPGQKVKFRIVNLDESLKPLLTDMEVSIKDSRSNLVDKQTHNISTLTSWSDKAVMTGEFQLSDMPNEGDWSINVMSVYGTESKSFSVRQYVLPKFSLELTVPTFVHFNDSEFTVQAKVSYTFDKAVEGTFNATIGPFMNCWHCKENYDQLEKFTTDSRENGMTNFTFNLTKWKTELLNRTRFNTGYSTYSVRATVQFTEKYTGEAKVEEKKFTIYKKLYTVKVSTDEVAFFLPGFKVPVQIKLMHPNGDEFNGIAASNLSVRLEYQQRGKQRSSEIYHGPLSTSLSGTGISLYLTIPASSDFHPVRIKAEILGDDGTVETDSSTINPFIAVTDEYVKISMTNASDFIEAKVKKSSAIRNVFYTVVSRSQIIQSGEYLNASLKFPKAELSIHVPHLTVIVFGLEKNGEIVAATSKYEIDRLGGKVSINSNLTKNKEEPQKWASIGVAAEPESFVFLTGIDHSVNLLATGQDILHSTLSTKYKSRLASVQRGGWLWFQSQRLTTARIIQENRLIVLSDAFYYNEESFSTWESGIADFSYKRHALGGAGAAVSLSTDARSSAPTSSASSITVVRKFFPETMVWSLVKTDSEGKARHAFLLPDTVTSWDLTAFGLSADKQIQTMDKAFKITTFKNFFLQPVLPYSLVRGEKFLLKVLVFNYREFDGKVSVSLNFTESSADAAVASGQTTSPIAPGTSKLPPAIEVSVKSNSVGLAIFELTPRSLPSLDIEIKATFTGQSISETDVVIKSILVIPEGKTVYKSRSVLLSPSASGASRPEQTVTIEYPIDSADLVSDSEVFGYSIIGDVMGPAMQNIGSLLRLPSGCGEQNMVNFAPAVFIWEYLKSTKQENSEIKEKALNVMKVGLQRQLTYKRQDGSYSAFGESDQAGSAWLTAFVLSIYAKASAFITIEPNALTGISVRFLLEMQSANGQFSEPAGARVLDRSLQGSSAEASHGMTAFICLSLLDVDEVSRTRPELQSTLWKDMDVKGAIRKCLWFVKSAFDSKPDNFTSYDLALSVYLLRRAQATEEYRQDSPATLVNAIHSALNARAESSASGEKFWSSTDLYWNRKIGSVEVSAWALLSSTLSGNTEESLQIVRWLSNQQSSIGGFQTSQATVVGIRALSAFAAKSTLVIGDANIQVVVSEQTQSYSVTESRRLVLKQSQLIRGSNGRVGSVVVRHASGTGFALVTLSWQYNLLDKLPLTTEWKEANGLGIRIDPSASVPAGKGQFRLSVCAKSNASEGMLILRVTNPSGFSATQLPQTSMIPGLKLMETGKREVVIYFDSLTADGVCITIGWSLEAPVLDLSPQIVSLQKYYNSQQIVSGTYLAPELKSQTKCKACPECPKCNPK